MRMIIGENWVDKDEKIDVRNPYNNELIDTIPAADKSDVEAVYQAAEEGYKINRGLPVHQRISILYKTAEILKGCAEEFARLGQLPLREVRLSRRLEKR